MAKTKVQSVRELNRIATRYMKNCDKDGTPYTLSGLAAALGITRKTLKDYAQRDDFGEAVSKIKQKIEAQMEERMLLGTSAASPSQFSLKNNFGWNDKVEIETTQDINIKSVRELSTTSLLRLLPCDMIREIEQQSKAAYEIELLKEENEYSKDKQSNTPK